ncbi:hypothetical protein K491DRAFT_686867 [Lophiostoma macrostomum CBS 122681]|uniref:DRBM domain-containing protein n=1 Tax=Lophiostoma macrostomum CBS 122681 TaxID=1314788 RepID=A0A6A6TQ23_9PLEO|nr:hypothetical protein K491DRAFT_686867 [Lophiostoma macrostomum CBS 122681]
MQPPLAADQRQAPMPGDDLLRSLIFPAAVERQIDNSTGTSSFDSSPKHLNSTLQEQHIQEQLLADMEVERATVPPPPALQGLSHGQHAADSVSNNAALGQISSVDDYLAQPMPVSTSSNSGPKAIATGIRSSANIMAVNEKYQLLALPRPDFIYDGSTFGGWSVKTSFLGHDLQEAGPYANKQEAKDVLSGRVLAIITALESEGKLQKSGKSKKKTNGVGSDYNLQSEKDQDQGPQENFIGQLLEFQNSTRCPPPVYQEYALGQNYACILTLRAYNPESATGSTETGPLTFGSMAELRSSKKAARQNAARLGVEYYKNRGVWPKMEDGGEHGNGGPGMGIRRKKVQAQNQAQGLTTATSSPGANAAPPSTNNSTSSSYAARVASLAQNTLAFPPPEYKYADDGVANFHTVACYFRGVAGHEGPIGEVRHVFGKKKAKEECAKLVLEYLLAVKEKRLRDFGMAGGDAKMHVQEGEEEEEDAFEDAVEDI